MARRFGANNSIFQDTAVPLTDENGIPLINTSAEFGASPLGISLREQIGFGLPNASFNLLPPDPYSQIIEGENPLPYWEIQTTSNITATPLYDTATQTWGIKVDPGTAPSGDYLTLKTRSWLTTDDNLAIRQKASLTLAKGGTYAGTTQWNLTLTAVYYDSTNTGIATAVIGTVYDNTTWTSISGTTTTGGSAIPASASWAEFTVKLTTTASVTSSTFVTLQSLLLATSTPATGSFVVTETFNASGTWTRPTGVNTLIAVVGVGGGGGGASGSATINNTVNADASGAGGCSGASSSWAIIKDLYVGDVSSVSVGIGAAGVGGTATTISKAAAGTARGTASCVSGGDGGSTTFGTYLTIPGGGGAVGPTYGPGTAATAPTSKVYGFAFLGSVGGAQGVNGLAGSASAYTQLPYWISFASGSAGGSGTQSSTGGGTTLVTAGGVAGSAGIIGAGGAGGSASYNATTDALASSAGYIGGYGGGSGGGGAAVRFTNTTTATVTGGSGGNAAANSGAGGGGGGGCNITAYPKGGANTNYNASTLTATTGAGGNGGAGRLYVVYVS